MNTKNLNKRSDSSDIESLRLIHKHGWSYRKFKSQFLKEMKEPQEEEEVMDKFCMFAYHYNSDHSLTVKQFVHEELK